MKATTSRRQRPSADQPLWTPSPEGLARSEIGRYLDWLSKTKALSFDSYEALWKWSIADLSDFWRSVWEWSDIVSHSAPHQILADKSMPGASWFPGATLNYAENALQGPSGRTAIIAVSQTRNRISMTFGELRTAVAQLRQQLQELDVQPGDRVAAYLPNIPEAVIGCLAAASLGAIWTAVAPEFGTKAVIDRFRQVDPTVLIAIDGYRYGSKDVDRRDAVAAIAASLSSLKAIIGVSHLFPDEPFGDLRWRDVTQRAATPEYTALPFDHPLWIVFSSGTTGLPKAITHSHGGITLELLKSHALAGNLRHDDRYFVYTTTSWVMWNILISALLVGSCIVLMDGNPSYPDSNELWRLVAAEQVTALCFGASILVQAARSGGPGHGLDLSRLRSIASTGSPLPAETFQWIYDNLGSDLYVHSSSGGTDVCTAFVGGSPMLPVRAGLIAAPALGVDVTALSETGAKVVGSPGELVIESPMPSMPVRFWNDPSGSKYHDAYFDVYPGKWRHGDWIVINEDLSSRIVGRSDGTLNRGGVRLGTADFYDVLTEIEDIADSLVVHLEDSHGGAGQLMLFVQLRPGHELHDGLRASIAGTLRSALSPRHQPDQIHAVPAIPYGLTGKKLEIPVKRILQGLPLAEVVSPGAVRDAGAFDWFVDYVRCVAATTSDEDPLQPVLQRPIEPGCEAASE